MNRAGVSLEMTEVTARCPLIRYLANDATYFAKYKSYVKDFNENSFTSAKMNAIFDKNYNLISSSVMQEVAPYSFSSNTTAFHECYYPIGSSHCNKKSSSYDIFKIKTPNP